MKKFKFSLDSVLDYKTQMLELKVNDHSKALLDVRNQEDVIFQKERKYIALKNEFAERNKFGIKASLALNYENYIRLLEKSIKDEYEFLDELKKEELKKQLIVTEAKKETSSLEILKDKKLKTYNDEVQKKEEQFIDEFVSNKMSAKF